MPKKQAPLRVHKGRKTTRVTFSADKEVLEWARAQAKSDGRPFANWMAKQLEEMREKAKKAHHPHIPGPLNSPQRENPAREAASEDSSTRASDRKPK